MSEPGLPGEHLERILSKLSRVKRQGRGWVARCPAHEDTAPSLSIAEGRSGVLLKCWAGCPTQTIVDALGLQWSDLFFDELPRGERNERGRRPIPTRSLMIESKAAADRLMREPEVLRRAGVERGWAREALRRLEIGWDGERFTLPVTKADGSFHDVLRYDPFNGGRWKMLAGKGKSRLPWPAPERVEKPPKPWPLLIVEGEGTAITLMSCGIRAVALPGAVSRPTGDFRFPGRFRGVGWHPSWVSRFKGFRELALFSDDDESGRTLMYTVAADLEIAHVPYVQVMLELGDGRDIGDVARWAVTRDLRVSFKSVLLAAIETARADRSQLKDAGALLLAWEQHARAASSDASV